MTETPEAAAQPETQVYFVRFAMNIEAPSPGDAVAGMVDLLVERGLRDWTYRVDKAPTDDQPGELLGYFDGYGEDRVLESSVEEPIEASPDSSEPAATLAGDSEPATDDEGLTEYAETLTGTQSLT